MRVALSVLPETLGIEFFQVLFAREGPWFCGAGSAVLRVNRLQVLHVLDRVLQLFHIIPSLVCVVEAGRTGPESPMQKRGMTFRNKSPKRNVSSLMFCCKHAAWAHGHGWYLRRPFDTDQTAIEDGRWRQRQAYATQRLGNQSTLIGDRVSKTAFFLLVIQAHSRQLVVNSMRG